jgi:predicted permease
MAMGLAFGGIVVQPQVQCPHAGNTAADGSAQVLKSSVAAMTELITSSAIGYIATRKGLLDRPTLQSLSRSVYGIFLPALLFVNVGSTMAKQPSLSLAALPVFAWVQILLGFWIARGFRAILGVDALSEEVRA